MAPQQAHWRLFVHTAKCFWRCNVSKESIIVCPWKKRSSRSMYTKLEWEAIQLLQMLVHHVLHKSTHNEAPKNDQNISEWSFEHLVAYHSLPMNEWIEWMFRGPNDPNATTRSCQTAMCVFRWTATQWWETPWWDYYVKKCWNLRPFTSHQNTRTNT